MKIIELSSKHLSDNDRLWLDNTRDKSRNGQPELAAGIYFNPFGYIISVATLLNDPEIKKQPMLEACLIYAAQNQADYVLFDPEAPINNKLLNCSK